MNNLKLSDLKMSNQESLHLEVIIHNLYSLLILTHDPVTKELILKMKSLAEDVRARGGE